MEILKALGFDARILILDEPTAVLTPPEVEELLGVIAELKARGPHDPVHHPQAERGQSGFRSGHRASSRPAHFDPPYLRTFRSGDRTRHGGTRHEAAKAGREATIATLGAR